MLFPYSGSKARIIPYLPGPPPSTHTIIEPFGGSAAYSMHWQPQTTLLAESNTDLYKLWKWLVVAASKTELIDFQEQMAKWQEANETFDLRDLDASPELVTLARLCCSGLYVGQLSSWVYYPQHTFAIDRLIYSLRYIKKSVRVFNDGLSLLYAAHTCAYGYLLFLDPPYLGTSGNYIDKTGHKDRGREDMVKEIVASLDNIHCPVIFTYGSDAPIVFPQYDWIVACSRRTPRARGGGTLKRIEHFALLNWSCE